MNLYSIDDKGNLIELSNLEFENNHVYLIDDIEKKTLYIWVGLDVLQYKKDLAAAWARRIDKDRGSACKILIMMQKREYGSFLSMMDHLKKGLIPGKSTERRPELVLLAPTEESLYPTNEENEEIKEDLFESGTVAWLKQLKKHRKPVAEKLTEETEPSIKEQEELVVEERVGLESQIREAAYYLALKRYSYNDLCWLLAESIENVRLELPSLEDIHKKAEEVFNSSSTYDELCWLNAQMDILIEHQFLEKMRKYN
ncbi:MAG: hypothetical protein KGD61_01270 [Candidatus Lokiarchaeota archaeon]|nr:hypothetical protein [Candidatus Lokiarchaeota archaeon]